MEGEVTTADFPDTQLDQTKGHLAGSSSKANSLHQDLSSVKNIILPEEPPPQAEKEPTQTGTALKDYLWLFGVATAAAAFWVARSLK